MERSNSGSNGNHSSKVCVSKTFKKPATARSVLRVDTHLCGGCLIVIVWALARITEWVAAATAAAIWKGTQEGEESRMEWL